MNKCNCVINLVTCECASLCRPPLCRKAVCQDKEATQKQIDQVVRIPSSLFLYRLTSACSPDYVRPTNEGLKHDSYARVLQRRRSICKK